MASTSVCIFMAMGRRGDSLYLAVRHRNDGEPLSAERLAIYVYDTATLTRKRILDLGIRDPKRVSMVSEEIRRNLPSIDRRPPSVSW